MSVETWVGIGGFALTIAAIIYSAGGITAKVNAIITWQDKYEKKDDDWKTEHERKDDSKFGEILTGNSKLRERISRLEGHDDRHGGYKKTIQDT